MLDWLFMERWSPYVVGAGIGILSWLAFSLSDQPIRCSTAFTRMGGMIERLIRGSAADGKAYYKKYPIQLDWGVMLLLGIPIGAFLAALSSGTFSLRWVPELWQSSISSSSGLRVAAAFFGGAIMGFSSRWAGGCTSGHGISGTMQLAVSSWISLIMFFLTAMLTAAVVY